MELGGILLTGGYSRRMGHDKAALVVDGVTLAARTAGLLSAVTTAAVEVGPGASMLPSCREDPPGSGPLAAVAAGYRELLFLGLATDAAVLVVACDLPRLRLSVLARLAVEPGERSVLPVIGGVAQPLCARWAATDLRDVGVALSSGARSLRAHPDRERAVVLGEAAFGADAESFSDVDTPADLRRLGLAFRGDDAQR